MSIRPLLQTLLFAALSIGTTQALAEKPAAPQQQAAPVTEKDIQHFAEAHQKVMQVRQEYIGKAKNTEGKQQKAQLQMAMQKDMLAAVQETGMQPKRYNQVARQVGQDEELRERVNEVLQE